MATPQIQSRPLVPMVALLTAMTSIQWGAALAKRLFPELGAPGTTTLRLLFAATLLTLAWRPWRRLLTSRECLWIGIYGVSLGFMNFFFYLAIERIPLGVAVGLEFSGPLAVAVSLCRRAVDFVWAALAAAGIFMLLPMADASGGLDGVGVTYALLAGVGWACYILFGQRAGATVPGGVVTAVGMAMGALVVLPLGVVMAGERLLDAQFYPLACAVAVLSSALPYSLEMFALQRLPAQTFGILMSVEPAVAALNGLLVLHEQLMPVQWLAIGCIVMASCGSAASSHHTNPALRPASP